MLVFPPLADTIHAVPSPNYGYGQENPWWRAVTWHITEGDLASTLSWLGSTASLASAHFVIARDGTIYNLVSLDRASWAQGNVRYPDLTNPIIRQTVEARVNPNLRSYSIECVGMSSWGRGGALTVVQAEALQRVTAYLCYRSVLTCDQTHVLGHYQWDSVGRAGCPGYSHAEWSEWVDRAANLCRLWRGW